MMNVTELDALIPLVVEDDRRLDRAILQDLDLRMPLCFGRARRNLDVGPHLRIEDDGRSFITGDTAGEDRYVLTGNVIGIGNRPAATGDSEDGDNPTPETHTASSVWDPTQRVHGKRVMTLCNRPGRNRTCNPRFWRGASQGSRRPAEFLSVRGRLRSRDTVSAHVCGSAPKSCYPGCTSGCTPAAAQSVSHTGASDLEREHFLGGVARRFEAVEVAVTLNLGDDRRAYCVTLGARSPIG